MVIMAPNDSDNGDNINKMSKTSMKRPTKKYPPCPDGGWGWMVVFGSFMIHVIADGVMYSSGLFYYELVKHFNASKAATSMVVSIMNGTTYCIGPIASALTIKFGCRAITIAGALFASLGFLLSPLAQSVYILYATIGICSGFGFGLMYLPAIVIVTSYFEKKRAFATGIAVCGSGIGTAIMSPLIEYIIQLYGWKIAMVVIAVLILFCVLFGAFFKPLPMIPTSEVDGQQNTQDTDLEDQIELKESNKSMLERLKQEKKFLLSFPIPTHLGTLLTRSSVDINVEPPPPEDYNDDNNENEIKKRSHSFSPGFLYREDTFYSGSLMNIHKSPFTEAQHQNHKVNKKKTPKDCFLFKKFNCPDEVKENISEMIDLSLMKNPVFLVFSISNFLTSVGYYIPYIYLKDRIIDMKIGSPNETGFFTSIIGIASTVSRLVFGYISDQSWVNRLWLYLISVTVCGIIICANTLATTYLLLAIFCALFGITCGTYVSLTSVVLVDLLSLEKLTNAFGLILLCQGLASLIGPFFIGFLYDLSGTYNSGFLIIGIVVAFSGLMLIIIPLSIHFKSLRKMFLY